MAEEEEGYDVTVISREEVVTYPKIATPVVQVLVTYVAAGLPPATVRIPKTEYSLDSEKAAIKEDIAARKARKVERYRIP